MADDERTCFASTQVPKGIVGKSLQSYICVTLILAVV